MNYKLLWISVRFENTDNLIWELIFNAQLLIKMVTKRSDVLWDYLFWSRLQAVNAVILDNHTSIGLPSSAATGSAMVTAKDKQWRVCVEAVVPALSPCALYTEQ